MRKAILVGLAGTALLVPASVSAQWRTPWSYDPASPSGPQHWGDIDPDYAACKTEKLQSPIDIRAAHKADLPPLAFDFHGGPVRIVNNGYTAVRVDYAAGNGDTLAVGQSRYELTQFHFHHPSEETLNGRRFAMNEHFMFKGADGKVVGAVVFVKAGRANPAISKLWAHMPPAKGPPQEIAGLSVDPTDLLPARRGYYRYTGSISAPPCNGGIVWYVLKEPIEASPAQIAAFAKLYPRDIRPLQPLNGRSIEESRAN